MKLSVVTICYNDREGLQKTIESVYNLDYNDYEYIVIDGASNDGSVDVALSYINRFKDKGIKFTLISEPDTGIYNAMNKGVKLGSGDYFIFLNSGDGFYDTQVLLKTSPYLDGVYDVIYGNRLRIKNKDKIVNEINKPIKEYGGYKTGLTFCHQSTFIKSLTMKKYMYDEKYELGADCKLFAELFRDNKKFKYIDETICFYAGGGVSSYISRQSLKENIMIEADMENEGILSIKYKIKYAFLLLKNKIKNKITK